MKTPLKQFFELSSGPELRAFVFCLLLLGLSFGAYHLFFRGDEALSTFQKDSTQLGYRSSRRYASQGRTYVYINGRERVAHTFEFDPNTADSTTLLALGLPPWVVRTIYRYRAKGGVYRSANDFARTPNLTKGDFERLLPFIRISNDYRPAGDFYATETKREYLRDTLRYPKKLQTLHSVPLNTRDTALLMRVPGVGAYFAKRIIHYGEQLGGYYSAEQLLEIEDFPPEAVKYFAPHGQVQRKMNINRLSLKELKRHPYIGYYQAKTIVDCRRLDGAYKTIDELKLMKDFPDSVRRKLKPYLEY